MIIDLLLLLVFSIGLGGFIPSPFENDDLSLGFRAFGGLCLMFFLFYAAIVPFRLGFDLSVYGIVGLATMGLGVMVIRVRRSSVTKLVILHPVVLFPTIIVIIRAFHGPVEFAPYGSDTYTNWLMHSKQIWLANDFWRDDFQTSVKGYPPGWHLMIAFTASLRGSFQTANTIALPSVIHIALLGLVFDTVVRWLQHQLGRTSGIANLVGLTFILLALSVEASWRLVPTLVMTEAPMFHILIGTFTVALMMWFRDARLYSLTVVIGLAVCAQWLIKTSGLVAVPIAGGMAVIGAYMNGPRDRRQFRQVLSCLGIALVPVMFAMLTWNSLGPQSPKCTLSVFSLIQKGFDQLGSATVPLSLLEDITDQTAAYFVGYKTPLAVLAALGVVAGLANRRTRWVALGLAGYVIVYQAAVYWIYLGCPGGFNSYPPGGAVSSLLRYLQLPVRAFHFIGILLLALIAIQVFKERYWAGVTRPVFVAAAATAAVLGAYQVYAIDKSLALIGEPEIDQKYFRYISTIKKETEAILSLSEDHGWVRPKVLIVQVYWESAPYLMALYSGYPNTRNFLPKDGSLSRWDLKFIRFATADSTTVFVGEIRNAEELENFDVIWATDHSDWLSLALEGQVDNPACVKRPADFYVVRNRNGGHPFICVPRLKKQTTPTTGTG